MTVVLLDTHTLHWCSAEPARLSANATEALKSAEPAVSAMTWYELAWLVVHGRITITVPLSTWLARLDAQVRTVPVTLTIAAIAAGLPDLFPGDPADRLIYATAIERGWQLVTKDRALRRHRHSRPITIW